MTPYVVDSSVAMKWYTPEPLSARAAGLQTCGAPLHAPDFIDVELAAVAWKKIRRTDRTVYDCLYLALAVQLGGVMVTADEKLANALAGTAWADRVLKLSALP